jgi:CRISPR-associated protein Cmr4
MTDDTQQHRGYECRVYIITARTNMHVGSGETSLGLVDNRVQRDVLTNLPNINSSGLKGALREHFTHYWGKDDPRLTSIFGSDSFARPETHQAGKFRFFNGNLLSIPVRSNVRPFYRATCPKILQELLDHMEVFGFDDQQHLKESIQYLLNLDPGNSPGNENKRINWIFTDEPGVELEEFEIKAQPMKVDSGHLDILRAIIGEPIVFMKWEDFKDITSDFHLPLVARNHLESGRSQNLWHEQVVPRESRFYFFLLKPAGNGPDLEFQVKQPVQIGGNASIGYGFTQIKKLQQFFPDQIKEAAA